jgi:hypothetical protein
MSEDRKRILDMLAAGKISAAEAEALLDALESHAAEPATGAVAEGLTPVGAPKFLYVKVTGKDRVDVKVPLGLVRAGLKLTSLIPPQAMDEINKSMGEAGMSIDFNNLKPEDIEELVMSLREMEVTVDAEDGNHVRVWCE